MVLCILYVYIYILITKVNINCIFGKDILVYLFYICWKEVSISWNSKMLNKLNWKTE